jgi:CMP/dCMP kinase
MKVTIFGLAGVGTSSVGKAVAHNLNYDFRSSGDMFRAKATELGLSLNDFEDKAKKENIFDLELDRMVAEYGRTHDNFVFESRLAWYFIPDSVKIKLACQFDERIRRIAGRDNLSIEEAKKQTVSREAAIAERYKNYYQLSDFSADKNFDVIIDTTFTSLSKVIEEVTEYLQEIIKKTETEDIV